MPICLYAYMPVRLCAYVLLFVLLRISSIIIVRVVFVWCFIPFLLLTLSCSVSISVSVLVSVLVSFSVSVSVSVSLCLCLCLHLYLSVCQFLCLSFCQCPFIKRFIEIYFSSHQRGEREREREREPM